MTEPDIAGLDDARAIQALALVLDRQGVLTDAADLRAEQQHLAEALPAAQAQGLAEPDPAATPGDLARTALAYLAATGQVSPGLIAQAAAIEPGPGERELVTLAVGALVLLAFRTELQLDHDPGHGWKIKVRTRPLSDSAVGKILGQLFGAYLKP
jgi:ferric-dicitrate binding protein FerR (iron transport regulator)